MDYPRDETTVADGGAGGSGTAASLVDVADFGSNPGNLRMRLHVPAGAGRDRPLVVALHGCTQTAAGFGAASGWMKLADAHDFLLLLPEQLSANNRKTCFSWFEPHDTRRGEGEVESIRQMIAATLAAHGADPRRVFVTGLSAGGAMACALAATYPELLAGVAIVAGLPYGAASGMAQAFDAMFIGRTREPRHWGDAVRAAAPAPARWPAVAIWHCGKDSVVKPINAGELVKQWTNVHGVGGAVPGEDQVGAATRRVWRDAGGRACVTEYRVPDLGHGMPVADDEPPAPFFLPAGLSAATQIARDFGLARGPAVARPAPGKPARKPRGILTRLGLVK